MTSWALFLALALMETAQAYALLALSLPGRFPFWALYLLYLVGLGVRRAFRRAVPQVYRLAVLYSGAAGALWLGLGAAQRAWAPWRPAFWAGLSVLWHPVTSGSAAFYVLLGLGLGGYLAWRAGALQEVTVEGIQYGFRAGVLTLAAAIFISWAFVDLSRARGPLTLAVLAFFLGGLSALSLAQLVRQGGRITRSWLGVFLTGLGGILLFGGGLSLAFSEELRRGVGWGLELLLRILLLLLTPFLIAFFWLLDRLLAPLLKTLSENIQALPTPSPPEMGEVPARQVGLPSPPEAFSPRALDLPVALVVLGVVAALLWLAYRWSRPPRTEEAEGREERESIWSWRELGRGLRALLQGMRRRRSDLADWSRRHLRGSDPRIRVRRAYAHLLLVAGRRGLARRPAETPREFRGRLPALPPLERLTRLYERARYGDRATDADAEAAEQALEEGRRLLEGR